MVSLTLRVLTAASAVLALTPPGFQPAAQSELIVEFQTVEANGQVLQRDATQTEPTIGTAQKLTGTSFAVIMVDLDIPTNNPPQTNTLLHWMQTGLTQAQQATRVGQKQVFVLQKSQNTAAAANYIGPNPPARLPLSHRYVQILVDTSGVQTQALSTLQTAAMTRMGFNAMQVLMQAGLQGKVVAGNFFNVTNPGPVNATATGGGNSTGGNNGGRTGGNSGANSGNGSGNSSSRATPSGTGSGARPTGTVVTAGASIIGPQVMLAGLLAAAAMFL